MEIPHGCEQEDQDRQEDQDYQDRQDHITSTGTLPLPTPTDMPAPLTNAMRRFLLAWGALVHHRDPQVLLLYIERQRALGPSVRASAGDGILHLA